MYTIFVTIQEIRRLHVHWEYYEFQLETKNMAFVQFIWVPVIFCLRQLAITPWTTDTQRDFFFQKFQTFGLRLTNWAWKNLGHLDTFVEITQVRICWLFFDYHLFSAFNILYIITLKAKPEIFTSWTDITLIVCIMYIGCF